METKTKVTQEAFIKNPKCKMCGNKIDHKWLDGDYSLLICSKKCLNKYTEK